MLQARSARRRAFFRLPSPVEYGYGTRSVPATIAAPPRQYHNSKQRTTDKFGNEIADSELEGRWPVY
jgi:hypothetical protein